MQSMKVVSDFTLHAPKTVTFKTTPPGDDVTGYSATLFRRSAHHPPVIVKSWSATQLEAGVQLFFDATAGTQYEISLGATVTAATTMDTLTTFSPKPPADSPKTIDLEPGDLNVRFWIFRPKG